MHLFNAELLTKKRREVSDTIRLRGRNVFRRRAGYFMTVTLLEAVDVLAIKEYCGAMLHLNV